MYHQFQATIQLSITFSIDKKKLYGNLGMKVLSIFTENEMTPMFAIPQQSKILDAWSPLQIKNQYHHPFSQVMSCILFQSSNETMFVVSLLSKKLFIHHCFPTTNICTVQWHSLIYPLYIVVKTYLLPASPVKVLYFSAYDTWLYFSLKSLSKP